MATWFDFGPINTAIIFVLRKRFAGFSCPANAHEEGRIRRFPSTFSNRKQTSSVYIYIYIHLNSRRIDIDVANARSRAHCISENLPVFPVYIAVNFCRFRDAYTTDGVYEKEAIRGIPVCRAGVHVVSPRYIRQSSKAYTAYRPWLFKSQRLSHGLNAKTCIQGGYGILRGFRLQYDALRDNRKMWSAHDDIHARSILIFGRFSFSFRDVFFYFLSTRVCSDYFSKCFGD